MYGRYTGIPAPPNEDPRYALVMTSVEADARGLTDCSAAL